MGDLKIREPIQKRSIEKKEKILKAGFELICSEGYYNTNTAQIAKKANVSTGIVYQYFKDKHDILISSLEKYADSIFFPMLNLPEFKFKKSDLAKLVNQMIESYISDHKLSHTAHEEIMAMTHSDKDVAYYYYKREMEMTDKIVQILEYNGFNKENLNERVHIMIGLIDNLCHEIVYHKHEHLNYEDMTKIVTESILNLLK